MKKRAQALLLTHRIPYPPDKGDKIRSWRLLKFLAENFDVHLACFADDRADLKHKEFLETQTASITIIPLSPAISRMKSFRGILSETPLTFEYFADARMAKAVTAIRENDIAVEIAFSSSMAPYIQTQIGARPRIIDFCDADSEKFKTYAKSAAWPLSMIYRREHALLQKAEVTIANWADASFAITPHEAALFNAMPGVERRVDWWSNGVDTEYFDPGQVYTAGVFSPDVVFVGAMDYKANIDGCLAFVRDVWPRIRDQKSDARFAIVGRNPARAIEALHGRDGIYVAGSVADVRPWLNLAKVAVAPLIVARGIQNKVLEAMAMGKPVVATPEAMTGIDARCCVRSARLGPDFANEIIALLGSHQMRNDLSAEARHLVVTNYGWGAQLDRFRDRLERVVRGYSSSSDPALS